MRWLLDRVYIYSYAFVLITPSKKRPYQAASFSVALTILMHTSGFLLLLSGFVHRNLMGTFGKLGIVIVALSIIAAVTHYFLGTKHAQSLVQKTAGELALPRTKWIGLVIVLWTFCVPFVCIALIIFLHREHVI